ncbi:MAG: hypothetical protein ABI718_08695 [Acidobacteriota bacterium]
MDKFVPAAETHTRSPEWSRMVAASIKHSGIWDTYFNLVETTKTHPGDLAVRGYLEIARARIVGELLSRYGGMAAVPSVTREFRKHYDRYSLNAQEGYLASLIDGTLSIRHLLKVSPLDQFTTIFLLAKLDHLKAISIP